MPINFERLKSCELHHVFPTVKDALYDYIAPVYGWDDDFQKARLSNDYKAHWYYWIHCDHDVIGLVCFKVRNACLHLHLLILFPAFQGKGMGEEVMQHLHVLAGRSACESIVLSSFISNKRACRFYRKLGYQVALAEEDFLNFILHIDA